MGNSNNNNICLSLLLFIALTIQFCPICSKEGLHKDSSSARPRGVSPQLEALYKERANFECLDGKKSIPFEQVNDDYCDCADGSDEPGTSACKNGHFYCPNVGFRPQTVPSSRVNDFICDCCDGSDEWDSGTECPNVCNSLGAKAREEAQQQAEVQVAGYAKRKELAIEGAKRLAEMKLQFDKKQKELDELSELKKGVEEAKKEVEALEKEAKDREEKEWEEVKKERAETEAKQMFDKMDQNGDGKVSSEELKRFAIDGGAEKGDKVGERGNELLSEIFKRDGDGDGAEKEEQSQAESIDFDAFLQKINTVKEFVEVSTSGAAEKQDAQIPADTEGEEEDKSVEQQQHVEEETEGDQKYGEQTRQLIEKADQARKDYDEVADKVSELETAVRESSSYLDVEFGPDSAWAPLKGQCAELTTTQYVYKLCMFDRTVQKDRNGHAEISLGHWGKWAGPEDGNKFEAQRYEHGQTCWNGPERSTLVHFECGEQFQLVDASEPSKCEYHFLAKSPTVCANPEELKGEEHAEL